MPVTLIFKTGYVESCSTGVAMWTNNRVFTADDVDNVLSNFAQCVEMHAKSEKNEHRKCCDKVKAINDSAKETKMLKGYQNYCSKCGRSMAWYQSEPTEDDIHMYIRSMITDDTDRFDHELWEILQANGWCNFDVIPVGDIISINESGEQVITSFLKDEKGESRFPCDKLDTRIVVTKGAETVQ